MTSNVYTFLEKGHEYIKSAEDLARVRILAARVGLTTSSYETKEKLNSLISKLSQRILTSSQTTQEQFATKISHEEVLVKNTAAKEDLVENNQRNEESVFYKHPHDKENSQSKNNVKRCFHLLSRTPTSSKTNALILGLLGILTIGAGIAFALSPTSTSASFSQLSQSDFEQNSPVNAEEICNHTFKIKEKNPTCAIKSLKAINEIPIEILEKRMRPSANYLDSQFESSSEGFIGHKENLINLLAEDNEGVLKHHFTHQQLAAPICTITNEHYSSTITFENKVYYAYAACSKGFQSSPFSDEEVGYCDYKVRRLYGGLVPGLKTLSFSQLHCSMIHRYGFYQGKGTSYRLEPRDIINFFELKPSSI